MGLLDWMKRGDAPGSTKSESQPKPSAMDEMPFRFHKPFAHLELFMSPEERKVVDGIEARWRERYERFKDYPPMSEGQEHDTKVFRAIDGVHRAFDAREHAPFKEWKRLEADVDAAIGKARAAFREQRRFVGREVAEARDYGRKLAPDDRRRKKPRSHER